MISSIGIYSQVSSGNTVVIKSEKIGTKKDKLDDATIRCYYQFTQPVSTDHETRQATDTMTLDIGSKISLYYDATRIRRDSVFNSIMGQKISSIKSVSVVKEQTVSL